MTEDETDQPLDGDTIGPDGKISLGKDGKAKADGAGKGKKSGKPPDDTMRDRVRKSKQTPEEREREEKGAKVFNDLVLSGGFKWRRADWGPNEDERGIVKVLSFCGYTQEDIAMAVGMSVETLVYWFERELKTARMLAVGDLANRALHRARAGNDTMTIFLLKTRGGSNFSEKGEQARVLGETLKDAEGLSDEKKQQVIASLVDLLNPKPKKPEPTTKDGEKT